MSHEREMMQIQVGAFAAIGLLLLMTIVFMLGSEKNIFEKQYTLICRFNDISGLRVGAPVQLAGIHVGTVNQILFDEKERKKVKLILRITKGYQERIRKDSTAAIVTQGLLGDKMVFVTVGSPEQDPLQEGDELPTRSPSGFYQILEKGDELIDNANKVAKKIDAILQEVQKGKGLIHGLVYDPEGGELVHDLAAVGENLNSASLQAAQITRKINQGEGTFGALINDASLFNDMKTLLGKANRNKLIRAVIRETLRTKEEKTLKNP